MLTLEQVRLLEETRRRRQFRPRPQGRKESPHVRCSRFGGFHKGKAWQGLDHSRCKCQFAVKNDQVQFDATLHVARGSPLTIVFVETGHTSCFVFSLSCEMFWKQRLRFAESDVLCAPTGTRVQTDLPSNSSSSFSTSSFGFGRSSIASLTMSTFGGRTMVSLNGTIGSDGFISTLA